MRQKLACKWSAFSKEDFFNGARYSYLNAKNHFESARILKEKFQIGFAISHLVYAGEEIAKCVILCFAEPGDSEYGKFLNEIFSRHKPKHSAVNLFSVFLFFVKNDFKKPF